MNIEHVSGFKYRIPKEGKMRVDVTFYASEGILKDLKAENHASLQQICNVATLPGIVESALTMPYIHWGYGFPKGGVAAFDLEEGGVVSPGGVGFDINCGVRLLVSEISREEVDPHKNRLAGAQRDRPGREGVILCKSARLGSRQIRSPSKETWASPTKPEESCCSPMAAGVAGTAPETATSPKLCARRDWRPV